MQRDLRSHAIFLPERAAVCSLARRDGQARAIFSSDSARTDRQGVRRNGLDNELNIGLGLNYTAHEDARGVGFVEAGFYRDSGSHLAKIAGVGYQYKLGKRWRLGGALLGVQSPTYNRGRFFIAPLPIATVRRLRILFQPAAGEVIRAAKA